MNPFPSSNHHPSNQANPAAFHFWIDINSNYTGKIKPKDRRFWKFNMSFQTRQVTPDELIRSIQSGYAWTSPHRKIRHHRPRPDNPNYYSTYRVKKNVISVQAIALDSDTGGRRSTFDWWLADPFVAGHAYFLHTTASHTEQSPRCRVVFLLSEPLDIQEAELAIKGFIWRYPHIDGSAKDASRVFYGVKDCQVSTPGHVLAVSRLREEIIAPYQAKLDAEKEQQRKRWEARLASLKGRPNLATGSQVVTYVARVLERRVADVAAAKEGTGQRHQLLYANSVRLGRLYAAGWLTAEAQSILQGAKQQLLAAAVANGYVAKYGQRDAQRNIDAGFDFGMQTPAYEPIWYPDDSSPFGVGDEVTAVTTSGRILTVGEVAQKKRAWDGVWLHKIKRAWYPAEMLHFKERFFQPAGQDEEEKSPVLAPPPPTAQAEPAVPPPPPPRNFPDGWAPAADEPLDEEEEPDID